jgi:benzodiazapine receptor
MTKTVATYLISILVSFAAGATGSLATAPNIPSWYSNLEKPFLNPPNWVFGPVWSILYLLIGISLAIIITTNIKSNMASTYFWFAGQLVLNTLWSIVFFGLHSPEYGIVIIIGLIISIIMTIRSFYPINKTAAALLLPYLLWVCFATYLNIAIAVLN